MTGKRVELVWQDSNGAGAVALHLEYALLSDGVTWLPWEYRVFGWRPGSSARPFTASVRACGRDDCVAGRVKPCARALADNGRHSGMKERQGREHNRTHCHGWHGGRAESLARQVLDTYEHCPV